jgi:hypothetical protein
MGLVLRAQAAIWLQDAPTGWEERHQGYERAAVSFGDASFAPGTRSVAESVDPTRIEGAPSFADGLLVAGEFSGDGPGALAGPTEHDPLGPADPIGGGMAAPSALAHLAFLHGILRWASHEQFGRETPPFTGGSCLHKLHLYCGMQH